jgi:hypothetical protein
MIIESGYRKALSLAIKVIQAFMAEHSMVPRSASKEFTELEQVYKDLTGDTI